MNFWLLIFSCLASSLSLSFAVLDNWAASLKPKSSSISNTFFFGS